MGKNEAVIYDLCDLFYLAGQFKVYADNLDMVADKETIAKWSQTIRELIEERLESMKES